MGRLICIFGNSHMSALKPSALNAEFAERGDDLRYWGLAGNSFTLFRYEDGRIISPFPNSSMRISGWSGDLNLAEVDVLVCYAFHIAPSYSLRSMQWTLMRQYGLSKAVREALIQALFDQWWEQLAGRRIMDDIRRNFPDLPMIFYAHPHVAEGSGLYEGLPEDDVRKLQTRLLAFLEEKITALGVTYRPQPEATVVEGLYTAREFNVDAVIFGTEGKAHEPDDYRHMNVHYGDHILRDLIGLLY